MVSRLHLLNMEVQRMLLNWNAILDIVRLSSDIHYGVFITRYIFPNYSQKIPHISPVRARYGVSFVGSDLDWYSASVPAMMCAITCYIIPRFNGTRLYLYLISKYMPTRANMAHHKPDLQIKCCLEKKQPNGMWALNPWHHSQRG